MGTTIQDFEPRSEPLDEETREQLVSKCQENGWLRVGGYDWQDDPFLKHDVNAYVRTEGGTLRVVPYGYDKQKRDLAWDPAALANYEFASGTGLPAVREYLEDMGRYARDGSQPQILYPTR